MKLKTWQIITLIVLGSCACLAVGSAGLMALSAAFPSPTSPQSLPSLPPPSATPIPTETTAPPEPTATPIPEITLPPSATPEPRQALRLAIEAALGTSNRDVPKITALNFDDPEPGAIFVHWTIDDNLTENFIIHGAQNDAADILKAIAASGLDYTYVILSGSFPMVDVYGKVEEKNVINLTFNKPTVDRIVWDTFLSDNIYFIADEAYIREAFHGDWDPTPMP
jgi:hypothetical protein